MAGRITDQDQYSKRSYVLVFLFVILFLVTVVLVALAGLRHSEIISVVSVQTLIFGALVAFILTIIAAVGVGISVIADERTKSS